jgi:hypothetical protein
VASRAAVAVAEAADHLERRALVPLAVTAVFLAALVVSRLLPVELLVLPVRVAGALSA